MTAWRGVNVLAGEPIVDAALSLLPCAIGTIVMAVLSIEFMFELPAPPRDALALARRADRVGRRRGRGSSCVDEARRHVRATSITELRVLPAGDARRSFAARRARVAPHDRPRRAHS